MEKKRGSLMVVIVGAIIASVIVTAIIISIFAITNTVSTNVSQTEAYRSRLLEDIMTELKNDTQQAMSV